MNNLLVKIFFCLVSTSVCSQTYWQQKVNYKIDIDFDVKTNQFSGTQILNYTNNSPDTLQKAFFHLYFNAFQPGSAMDTRSLTIEDPDKRVMDRIAKLNNEEIGYHKISALLQNGKSLSYHIEGTVLEVELEEAILPSTTTVFEMSFTSQVPLQIRRSGRDNAEGIAYSMAQWYPKIAEYDDRGWHAHPYIAREFYAPWGDFEVNITIDKNYVLAGTGILQNANEIGHGYENEGIKVKRKEKKITWMFKAENVHDFVWAADPDYKHLTRQVEGGPLLRFFYQENEKTTEWTKLPELTVKAFEFIEENYGEYPYSQYSIIQGGDGGMEYPMATLITGERNLKSLFGVTVHEVLHSWYQGLLGTNESYYAWMDEGFTTYATTETISHIFLDIDRTQERNFASYHYLVKSGKEEPLSTHSDHFDTNLGYGLGSYYKGAIALAQMNYLIGKATTAKALKRYYYEWRFKHPDANDWIRVFEKESKLELDWYLDYWINTTHSIDYAIKDVRENEGKTAIALERVGKMPMPIDLFVTLKDGSEIYYYIPLAMMRGEKPNETSMERILLPDWSWTHPSYNFTVEIPFDKIASVKIDKSGFLADIELSNNTWGEE